jgi:site-specific DNA recombinase
MMKQPGLKFAPLIRVSTERQKQQGESLATQRTDLENDIKNMGGKIYDWYAGQEHATPDYERKILDRLISDAQQHKFDALIIWSLDRWSRDEVRGGQNLKILRDNGIRFFERTREYNLHDENEYFMIALYGLMGRTQAIGQTRKSIKNRIHRAKEGFPTCGKLPYGRTYSKEKGWGIDRSKQKFVEDVAKRYLKGESLTVIAKEFGINRPNLNKLLKRRSGDTWEQHFISKKLNIDETVITKVPRLLPKKTIEQLLQRSKSNQTYTHGLSKHSYLLSRMIFCESCGFAMSGQTNQKKLSYYRHAYDDSCDAFNSIRGDLIENCVMDDIFRMLGDRPKIEEAAKAAVPNLAEIEALTEEIDLNKKQLVKIKKGKDLLVAAVMSDTMNKEDIKEQMTKLKEREVLLQAQIDIATIKCDSIPTKEEITRKSTLLLRLTENILKGQKHLEEISFEDKRKILQYAFDGKDADGKRFGVYIDRDSKGNWLYTIRGAFIDSKGIRRDIDIFDVAKKVDSKSLELLGNKDKQWMRRL